MPLFGNTQTIEQATIYQRIELTLDDPEDIGLISSLGLDLQCGTEMRKAGDVHIISLEVSQAQHQQIRSRGIQTDILIDNISKHYADRAVRDLPRLNKNCKNPNNYTRIETDSTIKIWAVQKIYFLYLKTSILGVWEDLLLTKNY